MATAALKRDDAITRLGKGTRRAFITLGELADFSVRSLGWLVRRRPGKGTLVPIFYAVGVRSVSVIALTGLFIGMVLAVQAYTEFHSLGIATRLGSMINVSVVRELGPVLAATMLAGRVGSAMAAELATMRISEQVDALACLGVHPLHYLVVPRFLACVLLIPLLTILADGTGILGGAFICTEVYGIEPHHYWEHSRKWVGMWDISVGLVKSVFFGAAIALISCQRGFHSKPGAEGVGQAATSAFVASFIAILALDLFLALALNEVHERLWPGAVKSF